MMKMFYIMTRVAVTLLYTFAITHQIVNINVNFIVCKLYFNKGDYKKSSPIDDQKIVESGCSTRKF